MFSLYMYQMYQKYHLKSVSKNKSWCTQAAGGRPYSSRVGGSNFYLCTARRESLIFKVQSKEIFFLHLQYLKKCIIDEKEEESGASCLTIVNNVKTFTRCSSTTKGLLLLSIRRGYNTHTEWWMVFSGTHTCVVTCRAYTSCTRTVESLPCHLHGIL